MRLDRLVCRFLLPGQDSVTDEGLTAKLTARSGETVLAFRPGADDHELCGQAGGVPIADALFIWLGERTSGPPWDDHPVLLAVECKTSMVDAHAIDQAISLLGVVVRDMTPEAVGRVLASVLTSRAAPNDTTARWKKRALEVSGVVLDVVTIPRGQAHDFRSSLPRARVARPAELVSRIGKALDDD